MSMRRTTARTLARCLTLVLWCTSAAAQAIPAPVPLEQLEADARDIVEGTVIAATHLKTTKQGPYATAHYAGVLKIKQVLKGDLKTGAELPLHWSAESWIGKGQQPPGRGQQPSFYPCEVVRLYLWRSQVKGKTFYNVSGRRLLRAPPTYMAPSDRRRTLRCVRGKPQ